jgi:branched-chain amino acid transport system ATP-binding protein
MILETQGLSKNFGRLAALVDVSFQAEEGEIFGIAGPNGAGKSTLFNVIAGVYPPSSGQTFFEGQDITGLSPHQICHRGIARTFQIPTTFHSMSVYDNIRVGATFGARRKDHVPKIIEFLNLDSKADALAKDLDLYTTKLVMLGAALATDCRLLMLDEPMAGLSIVEIEDFLTLVRKINQEWKITIVIIEHLLDILIGVSTRMLILHDGQVLYIGAPEKVTQDRRVVEVYLGEKVEEGHA